MTPVILSESRPVWGAGVRTLRGIHALTQSQLAAAAGTSQSRISEIENGSRAVADSLRVRIARALKVEPHELFPYIEDGV